MYFLAKRLAVRSQIMPNGCIEWTGGKTRSGYGQTSFGGASRHIFTHRAAYAIARGILPTEVEGVVRHSCDNPSCINPRHLSLGTTKDNVRDRVERGRQTRGIAHPLAKLSAEKVRAIRADKRAQRAIAADYGISQARVGLIKRRLIWKHVSD